MTHETQKIARISNVLLNFLLSLQGKDLTLSIHEEDAKIYIVVLCQYIKISNKKLELLENFLYMERQEEMEEYYWHLVGNDSETEEISLIGMMVDEALVEYVENELKISLVRYI